MIPSLPKGHEPISPTIGQYPPDGMRFWRKGLKVWHGWPLCDTDIITESDLEAYHFCAPADVERLLAERDALRVALTQIADIPAVAFTRSQLEMATRTVDRMEQIAKAALAATAGPEAAK